MVQAIKFYANWCGPCKEYNKVWDKVEKELQDKVEFKQINVDKDDEGLSVKYAVRSIPFTVVIKDETTTSKVGLLTEEELKELINN
tara:strand:+ start:1127 stop:1384 length:258 start_codon:yes stop_codon:yes gene_type:complete